MRIVLVTPYGRDHRNGNWHTAARYAHFLREAGHRVRTQVEWDGRDADLMIALHARRSAAAIHAFAARFPQRPLIVVLTGTDLYRDVRDHADAQRSLALAHRLVVLQERGPQELPPPLAAKTRVIYQSAPDVARAPCRKRTFDVLSIGHLREEKDPLLPALATACLPADSRIRVDHLGRALSAAMADSAAAAARQFPRWHWRGDVPHGEVLRRLARARLLVIASRMEGGANVICEALAAGVPVLASAIAGNVGMLGEDYPGYFPVGDHARLGALMALAERDAGFYADIARHARIRRERMRPQREADALCRLVAECMDAGTPA
jgi:putative glycosyltransferase (TIGR04348 family)